MLSKPVILTILLSVLLFLVLVILGVKYHWTGLIFDSKSPSDSQELAIPERKAETLNQDTTDPITEDTGEQFEPELMDAGKASSLIESMTKQQVNQGCQALMKKTMKDNSAIELAVVNCVVSNYNETFEEAQAIKKTTQMNQIETQISQQCIGENMYLEGFSLLQKQLLTGICVSDLMAQELAN